MKKTFLTFVPMLILLSLVFCSKSPTDSGVTPTFLTLPGDLWRDVNDEDHFVLIINDSDSVAGAFTGREDHNTIENLNGNDVNGTYSENKLEFTIDRPGGSVKFEGKFVIEGDSVITALDLASEYGEKLVLVINSI